MNEIIKSRIDDKIEEIQKGMEELYLIVPETYEDYLSDFKSRAACERYFEKIVEAVVDITFLVIRGKEYEPPKKEEGAFQILALNGIISENLAEKLKDGKSMRNFIAHEYGDIDDSKVYHAIAEELESDIEEFIKSVREIR